METFLAMPPAPYVSKSTVLGVEQGASGLWVATYVQIITDDVDLMSYLAATVQVRGSQPNKCLCSSHSMHAGNKQVHQANV